MPLFSTGMAGTLDSWPYDCSDDFANENQEFVRQIKSGSDCSDDLVSSSTNHQPIEGDCLDEETDYLWIYLDSSNQCFDPSCLTLAAGGSTTKSF